MAERIDDSSFSIDLFREGNQHQFRYVFDLLYDRMYLFANNLVKTEHEAIDITSESFIKLWKLHENFESLENIKAFLYVTTRNACLDYFRFLHKQRTAQKEILYLLDKEHRVDNEQIEAEVIGLLSKFIDDLPQKCREIFKLIYYHNLRTSEVAEQLAITQRNVLNQKARAIQILRSAMVKNAVLQTAVFCLLFLVR
jgi:RNA polymerase sigma-70 factor (family 1)